VKVWAETRGAAKARAARALENIVWSMDVCKTLCNRGQHGMA